MTATTYAHRLIVTGGRGVIVTDFFLAGVPLL